MRPENTQAVSGMIWCFVWLSINIGTTLLNKAMFSNFYFPYPITLSFIHMIFTFTFSWIVMTIENDKMKDLTWNQHGMLAAFSLLFALNILAGNIGIKYVTVALGQVVRASIPGITMILSIMILKKRYTFKHTLAVSVVIFGVAMATYGDLQFHLFGFLVLVAGCFLSSFKSITTSLFLVGSLKFHPHELAFRMALLASFQMGILAFLVGETEQMMVADEWRDPSVIFALSINGFMAFLLNYSNFMFTKSTSPLTVTVAGSIKNVLTILISIFIFTTPVSFTNSMGTLIAIFGATLYSLVDFKNPAQNNHSSHSPPSDPTLSSVASEMMENRHSESSTEFSSSVEIGTMQSDSSGIKIPDQKNRSVLPYTNTDLAKPTS